MFRESPVKVVIVGAGLSGLSAAEHLLKANNTLDVTVLEAKDRVGGRTLSVKMHDTIYDFGAMYVGPQHTQVIALATRAKNSLIPQDTDGLKILEFNGKASTYRSDIPNNVSIVGLLQLQYLFWRMNRMARTVPLKNPMNCPNGIYWDSITLYSWIQQNVWFEKVKKLLEGAVRGVFGVDTSEISMLFFLWYVHQNHSVDNLIKIRNGNQEKKLVYGTQQLSQYLKQEISKLGGKVMFNSAVNSINQSKDRVQITTKDGTLFQCDYVIIAAPPVCLSRIDFTPKLSLKREMISQRTFMGSTIKMIVLYEKQFWKIKGYSGEILSDCMDSPVYNAYDDSRPNDKGQLQPGILIFVNSGVSRHWGPKEQMTRRALQKLAEFYGEDALNPLEVHIQNWGDDEEMRGGPVTNFPPGLLSQVGDITQKEGRVYWAGTEMAQQAQGYMEGAIRAGKKAAVDVLSRMNTGQDSVPPIAQQKVPGYFGLISSFKGWFSRW